MDTITFATGNALEAQFAERAFQDYDLRLETVDAAVDAIQAHRCEAIARDRARKIAEGIGSPVIAAEDGLFVSALQGFPGPYAQYAGETIGVQGILKLLKSKQDRSARLDYVIAYAEPSGEEQVFRTATKGRIADGARGTGGMRVDRLFVPKGEELTLSEIAAVDFGLYRQYRDRSAPQFAEWYVNR